MLKRKLKEVSNDNVVNETMIKFCQIGTLDGITSAEMPLKNQLIGVAKVLVLLKKLQRFEENKENLQLTRQGLWRAAQETTNPYYFSIAIAMGEIINALKKGPQNEEAQKFVRAIEITIPLLEERKQMLLRKQKEETTQVKQPSSTTTFFFQAPSLSLEGNNNYPVDESRSDILSFDRLPKQSEPPVNTSENNSVL